MGTCGGRAVPGSSRGGAGARLGENPLPMPSPAAAREAYWRSTLRLSGALLAVWLLVTLGVCLAGPSLVFDFFGWPFGVWAAAQGALLVFCAIVWVYALAMDRLDRQHGAGGD